MIRAGWIVVRRRRTVERNDTLAFHGGARYASGDFPVLMTIELP